MKNIGLISIMLLGYFFSEAQSEKGTIQLGVGGLPIIYPDNAAENGFSLRTNIGYFPSNKLSVGIMPFVGKVEDMNSIGASIYLRYYVINKRISLFVEGGGGFGNLKYEDTPEYDGMMNSINIGPGFHYQFKRNSKNKLAVEFLLQYARLRNITYPESTFIGNTLIPTIGIQYFIKK